MRSITRTPMVLVLGLTLAFGMVACTDDESTNSASGSTSSEEKESAASADSSPTVDSTESSELPQGGEPVELNPADFTADITNPYFPLKPGTRMTYRELEEDGNELEVVVTATGQTKKIANGITARVVRDTVSEKNGGLVEDTFDWYAQDSEGNVWYMGEDTAEFKNGKIASRGGSFEAGVDGALPGIAMPADPQPGLAYRQEYYKGEAEDNGEILSTKEMADVPVRHFENLVLTKDTISLEPNVLEYKLYAKGVGQVLALGISGGGGREELVRIDEVSLKAGTGPLGAPNI